MEAEMLFILVLALIVLGPRRLPAIGRQIGRALAEFRRAKNEFTAQIEDEIQRLEVQERTAKPAQNATRAALTAPAAAPSGTVTQSAATSAAPASTANGIQETNA